MSQPEESTMLIDGQMRPTTNSRGLRIHVNDEGIVNFWRWFQNSKFVDVHGRPLVMYHGTHYDFGEFSKRKVGTNFTSPQKHLGHFFTDRADYAAAYAGKGFSRDDAHILPVYLAADNLVSETIATLNAIEDKWKHGEAKNYRSELVQAGHDGILFEGETPKFGIIREAVVFHASQIKSAIGNSGMFIPDSGNITDRLAVARLSYAKLRDAALQREIELMASATQLLEPAARKRP